VAAEYRQYGAYGSLPSSQQAVNRTANSLSLCSVRSSRRAPRAPRAGALLLHTLVSLPRGKRFARKRRPRCSCRTTDERTDYVTDCCCRHRLFRSCCSCCCAAQFSCAKRHLPCACPHHCPCLEPIQPLQKDSFPLLVHHMPHDLLSKSLVIVHNSRVVKDTCETTTWGSWISRRRH
jgi:hypothetical protein